MDQFVYAHNFRELVAYKGAFNVSRRIFDLSKGLPGRRKIRTHQSFCSSSRVAENDPSLKNEDVQDPLFTEH
jgi:hypothetical protein